MRRLFSTIIILACCLVLSAQDKVDSALAVVDGQIAQEQQAGDIEKEAEARWKRIEVLHAASQADRLLPETDIQMEWFRRNGQWDFYYRTWQRKTNILSMQGKLQLSLQQLQRMLADATERDNKLGRAMAYKQIGVIYLNMKQTEPAVEALLHYYDLMKDEGDIGSLSNVYYRMAKAFDYDKSYEEELQVTDRWLAFIREQEGQTDKSDIMSYYSACHQARAAAFIGLNQLDEAGAALDSAAFCARQSNSNLGRHHYYKMMARYFLARGDAARTLLYTDSVSLTTKEKDDHTDELRAQALMLQGKGMEAVSIYQRLYREKDSIFGHEARQHLDELNTLFKVDEIKTEQQRTKFRYTLIAAASIVLALLLLLLYGWRVAVRQRRANEQLRLANERALVSSKMKSEFIRNISHEIRTPLNIVSGFTQILTAPDMELPADEKADIQERVTENTERITKLVDRMLELSDVSSEVVIERNDKTDVGHLAAEAINQSQIVQLTSPANSDSAVTFEFPQDEATNAIQLLTNKLYAARTLTHLLENAVKFTHEGRIQLRVEATDSIVRFIIEDTGIGITAAEAEHIFEEFVQLDDFTEGTGVGLTVARSLARRMGGDLWLDTDYAPGARFVFELLRK